jgi:ABC-type Fe3+-hydroxamate transport system substrate-binding protein
MPTPAPATALGNLQALGLARPPQRVVSLVPSVTASLFDLGLGGRVAGVTEFCVYPPEGVARLPKVGGTKNPDVAAIVALNPDLVIANWEENREEDAAALRAGGLPVWVTFPRSAREALNMPWALIRLFDVPQAGHSLAALERSLEVTSLAAAETPPARVFCPIWREPRTAEGAAAWWMTGNHATYLHDVLRVCGGENVFAARDRRYPLAADLDPERHPPDAPLPGRDTRYPRVSPAEVAAAAPDVILLPSEPYPFSAADREAWAAWPAIPAVRAGRVHLVDGSALTWAGTRLALALGELPALLFPAERGR